jgi:amidophosphoribosyltransferase
MSRRHDRPREACGVVGVLTAGQPVAPLVRRGLVELQHRGEESAGIVTADTASGIRTLLSGPGLVPEALPTPAVDAMPGSLGLGHVRYSTYGTPGAVGAQPIVREAPGLWLAVAHNGNLINCADLASSVGFSVDADTTDSELVANLLADHATDRIAKGAAAQEAFESALMAVLPRLVGAFSLVLSEGARIYGVRDRNGLRPLCLGRLPYGWALASETPALDAMGATFVCEVEPGEMVVVEGETVRSLWPFPKDETRPRLCMFEFVYFARPDSVLGGQSVGVARHRAGEALADYAPLPPRKVLDSRCAVVVPIPSSAVPAARGYAARSGLRYAEGIELRATGRSFLAPAQAQRETKVDDKLVVVPAAVRGRRVVVVDDSLVRGTTTRAVVRMLREAGAAEVHLRIASPPWRWPCYLGIDAGDQASLAAAVSTLSEMADRLGCDSLAYLPLEEALAAMGRAPGQFCTGCMTGRYPVPVPSPLPRTQRELFVEASAVRPTSRGAVA